MTTPRLLRRTGMIRYDSDSYAMIDREIASGWAKKDTTTNALLVLEHAEEPQEQARIEVQSRAKSDPI